MPPSSARSIGRNWYVNCVMAPKLPPPPPRMAQNSSSCCVALASMTFSSRAVTMRAERTLSTVRPQVRAIGPKPPPCDSPLTPTSAHPPPGLARPRGYVAMSTCPQNAPAPTCTTSRSRSTRICCIALWSIMSAPSMEQ